MIAHYLQHVGVFAMIEERVRFARRRFGHYDVIDFVVMLLSYAISGERTLEAFYERVQLVNALKVRHMTRPRSFCVQPSGHLPRAERSHYRLSWEQRLARNARPKTAPEVSIKLFGIPDAFATSLSAFASPEHGLIPLS